MQQSLYKPDAKVDEVPQDPKVLHIDDGSKQIKIYDSQEQIEMKHLDKSPSK